MKQVGVFDMSAQRSETTQARHQHTRNIPQEDRIMQEMVYYVFEGDIQQIEVEEREAPVQIIRIHREMQYPFEGGIQPIDIEAWEVAV
jgi:hypothetical protein